MRSHPSPLRASSAAVTLAAAAALLLASACVTPHGAEHDQPAQQPDAPLQPGLAQLLPYDFGPSGRSVAGLRWLDNWALNQVGTPSALRARLWMLRARLDWLTWAYLLSDAEARDQALRSLLTELKLPHEGPLGDSHLFALLDALDVQASGLESAPELAETAASARTFIQLLRHLDLSLPYFEAGLKLKLLDAPTQEPTTEGPGAFAPNALLVVLADLESRAKELQPDPGRQAHALARLLPWSCPTGMLAFAGATLEDRLDRYRQACSFPCPEAARLDDPRQQLTSCATTSPPGASLISLDNHITLAALDSLSRLLIHIHWYGHHRGSFPLFALDAAHPHSISDFAPDLVPLTFPEHGGMAHTGAALLDLPAARYAPTPAPAQVTITVLTDGATFVAITPQARRDGDRWVVAPPGPDDQRWPGKRLDAPTEDALIEELRLLLTRLKPSDTDLEPFMAASALTLAADQDTPLARLLPVLHAARRLRLPFVQVVVSDPDTHRSGALRFELSEPPAAAPRIAVTPKALALTGLGRPTTFAASAEGGLPTTALYLHLVPTAARTDDDRLPHLVLAPEPDIRLRDLSATADALRYWRAVAESSDQPDAILRATPQEVDGVPKLFSLFIHLELPKQVAPP